MVSTVYSGSAVKYAITKLSPDIVIFVVEKELNKIKDDENIEKKKKSIEELKNFYKDTLQIEFLETKSLYDIYEITRDVIRKIDELPKEYEIITHISEGRKPLSFGLTFASYIRKDRVSGIYYVISETNEILKFPMFTFPINEIQKELLGLIDKGAGETEVLIKKSDKSRSVVYQYIKELEENGFIDRENGNIKLTELGRVVIV